MKRNLFAALAALPVTVVTTKAWPAGLTPPASPPPMRALDWSYCDRPRTLGSLTDLELNPLVIAQRIAPTNLGMVDEQIFSATVDSDKAIALIPVEPFDGSLCHALNFLMLADLEEHTAASLLGAGLTLVRTVGSGVALLAAPLASQGSSGSSAT